HSGPVLTLGAAGAGVNFEITVVGVGFAREQCFELAPRHLRLQALERGFRLADRLVVFLALAQLDHSELIVEIALDAADGVEAILKRVALTHHALTAALVAPQAGVFGLFVQFGETARRGVDVKDASSAAAATALFRRSGSGFRRA